MKLTDTQLVLLSAASQREDCAIELAPNLKGGAAHKVVGKLLTDGLIEEIQARGALPVWRRDGNIPSRSARGGTKQEGVLLEAPTPALTPNMWSAHVQG
jgi:hypothetical protein